jgi:hypothetical protein
VTGEEKDPTAGRVETDGKCRPRITTVSSTRAARPPTETRSTAAPTLVSIPITSVPGVGPAPTGPVNRGVDSSRAVAAAWALRRSTMRMHCV